MWGCPLFLWRAVIFFARWLRWMEHEHPPRPLDDEIEPVSLERERQPHNSFKYYYYITSLSSRFAHLQLQMKISTFFLATAVIGSVSASQHAAIDLDTGDIDASSELGSLIMSKARALEQNNNNQYMNWVSGYSIKFQQCFVSKIILLVLNLICFGCLQALHYFFFWRHRATTTVATSEETTTTTTKITITTTVTDSMEFTNNGTFV
jgi:hypothetical protein